MSSILECPACGFSNAYLQGVGMGNWSGYQNLLNFFSTSKRGRMNRKAPIEQVESAAFHLATYKCARCNCPNQRMNYEVHLKNGQIIFPNFSCSYCRGKELIEIDLSKIKLNSSPEYGEMGFFSCPKCKLSHMILCGELDWD